jgi:hypothetical protein
MDRGAGRSCFRSGPGAGVQSSTILMAASLALGAVRV